MKKESQKYNVIDGVLRMIYYHPHTRQEQEMVAGFVTIRIKNILK